MDWQSIIGYTCLALLFWFFTYRAMKAWFSRKEGTGKEVDLSKVGHRGPWEGGDFEPDTIGNIERMLKEQANDNTQ